MNTRTALHATPIQTRPLIVFILLGVLLNLAGITVKFFTDDPALYSLLARNMAHTNNFADLIYHGRDWLDKPHFPFWVAALSFKLFGVNTVAYKLPALIFFLMSVVYTYLLTRKFYGFETALISVLILLTSQHVIMSNTDVRAEPYIMGLLMGSVYHFYKVKLRFTWGDILLASLFAGCAVMTKGIYLLIPIGFAIIGDYLFKKNFKGLFHWKWLLAVLLTAVFILPEIYTLYTQFDLHPEKEVFGRTGMSGIHWFLWESQFGRFNNNSYIRNSHGSIFFFLHTLLWAFLPWAIVFFYALFKNIRNLLKGVGQPEYVALCASVPMLIIFSISKFQLPFYTNILFPFFAMILAVFLRRLTVGAELKFFNISQYIICGLLLIVLIALNILFAPQKLWIFIVIVMLLVLLTGYIYKNRGAAFQPVFLLSCCVVICVNIYVISVVYPLLVSYKGDVSAADFMNKNYPGKPLVSSVTSNRLDFYMKQPVKYIDANDAKKQAGQIIFTERQVLDQLKSEGVLFNVLKTFDNYGRENLTMPFINSFKRNTALNQYYLITLNNQAVNR
ncbi:ArnT family glycosyltransferase [Mucilaginibacter litoreus]|uniref:ArnT family glycosyltransferase n=1 Tax=Mucilaginibacter litoreus TaxID=1048221 RepID=A0ABW3AWY1_9SPHI